MAPIYSTTAPSLRRAPATVVGVDVTAHKEERHITDVKKAGKQSNTRMRYYVELVVGSPRESHTRLGFSGTFKALLRLHTAFEAIFNAQHAPIKTTSRESISSATSASSASSSSSVSHRRRISVPLGLVDSELVPKIRPFPTSHALMVKLQPRQHVESEDKARARSDALFAYYTALFNSEERELYLDHIQRSAEAKTSNQQDADQHQHYEEENANANERRSSVGGGFFKKLFSRRGDAAAENKTQNERQRASALDAKLEFAAPVHIEKKRSTRRH